MKALIQRVTNASVTIEGKLHSEIQQGLLVFLGISSDDTEVKLNTLAAKIINLRIFSDKDDKMNLSVKDINGEIMLISQFTLCADNGKSGNRPSFIYAARPEIAEPIYEKFITALQNEYKSEKVRTGVFGADMKINLINDGPVTIILER